MSTCSERTQRWSACLCGVAAGAMMLVASVHAGTTPDAAAIANRGDTTRGVPACAGCHGTAGQGNPEAGYPKLAHQAAAYLLGQLQALADGSRPNAVMGPVATALSASQRQAMATYYAALPSPATPPSSAPASLLEAGRQLAEHGRWADNLPACTLCHGRGGVGVGTRFPALAGQSATYLSNQLKAWQAHRRPPGPLGLMSGVAGRLSDSDIRAVSAFFAAQPARRRETTP